MKKVWQSFKKIAPAFMTCMAVVLTISANTSASFYFGQPETPKGLDEFRHIK